MDTVPGTRIIGASYRYQRHQSETTPLYPIVEQHLPALRNELQRHEVQLPRFVLTAFHDYLRCGRLEYGYMRRIPAPHPSGDLRSCKSAILPICRAREVQRLPG
jgi:hypothetical protein